MQHAATYIPGYRMQIIVRELSRENPFSPFLRDMNVSYPDRPAVGAAGVGCSQRTAGHPPKRNRFR